MMAFSDEGDFERALITVLFDKGWSHEVIKYPTEKDLIRNWADILYRNNCTVDRLDKYPLTDSEMGQILDQIKVLGSPYALNGFINGKTISIVRDNPEDKAHLGKSIPLKIYDRNEIAGGTSVYQIAEQPRFTPRNPIFPARHGDFMLLINGMPVIHVELKRSKVVTIFWRQMVALRTCGISLRSPVRQISKLDELHRSFATLSQEDQRYAKQILADIQNGNLAVDPLKTFTDYIAEYAERAKNDQIHQFADAFGASERLLRTIMSHPVTAATLNQFNRFDALIRTVDRVKAAAYFSAVEGHPVSAFLVTSKVDDIFRRFILHGGFPIAKVFACAHGSESSGVNYDAGKLEEFLEAARSPPTVRSCRSP